MPEVVHINSHILEREEDGTFHYREIGTTSLDEAQRLVAQMALWTTPNQTVFFLADHTKTGDLSAEARKYYASSGAMTGDIVLATYGDSFQTRVMSNFVLTAMAAFGRPVPTAKFFKDEASARVYLKEQRAALAARTPNPAR